MIKRINPLALILLFLVLIGQQFSLQHSLDHGLITDPAELCELCLAAHESETGVLPGAVAGSGFSLLFLIVLRLIQPLTRPLAFFQVPQARAPPVFV